MAKAETDISNKIRIALSQVGARMFRNHRGKHLTLDGKRIVTTGLFDGASDLIGWTPVVVTQAMVGKQVALFTSIEVKSGNNEPSAAQGTWIEAVERDGGIAFVARTADGADRIVCDRVWNLTRLPIRVLLPA